MSREMPITELGLLQSLEITEREIAAEGTRASADSARHRATIKEFEAHRGEILKRLERLRSGETLPFEAEADEQDEDVVDAEFSDQTAITILPDEEPPTKGNPWRKKKGASGD